MFDCNVYVVYALSGEPRTLELISPFLEKFCSVRYFRGLILCQLFRCFEQFPRILNPMLAGCLHGDLEKVNGSIKNTNSIKQRIVRSQRSVKAIMSLVYCGRNIFKVFLIAVVSSPALVERAKKIRDRSEDTDDKEWPR